MGVATGEVAVEITNPKDRRCCITMYRKVFTAAALIAALAVVVSGAVAFGPFRSAAAQTQPPTTNVATQPRTITVLGDGTVSVQPNIAQIQVGIEVTGENAQEASAESSSTMKDILAAFSKLGVAKKDLQTSGYNIYVERPVGPDGTATGKVIYHVGNSVSVTVRDLTKVGDVLDAAIAAGANSIYGVNFSVDKPEQLMGEARKKAAADALARAQELAALHGVTLGEVVSISEVTGGMGPMLANANYSVAQQANIGDQILPGELQMSTQLQVTYAIAGAAGE